jgi:hypothetical protein
MLASAPCCWATEESLVRAEIAMPIQIEVVAAYSVADGLESRACQPASPGPTRIRIASTSQLGQIGPPPK